MKLVENYLNQVDEHLSSNTDNDVLKELESDIYDAIEGKEDETEHQLNDQEIANILRKFGPPMEVAASYAPQQFLIGPMLFPTFKYSVKIAVSIVIVIQCLRMILGFIFTESVHLNIADFLASIISTSLWAIGISVAIFATLEFYGEKFPTMTPWDPLKISTQKQSKGDREDAVTNVISDTVILFFWNMWVGPALQNTTEIGALSITFSDMYVALFWPVNALILGSVMLYSWQILSNSWNKLRINLAMLIDVLSLIILVLLMASTDQVLFTNIDDELLNNIGHDFAAHASTVFKSILVVVFGLTAYDLWKHSKIWRKLNAF